MMSAEITNFAIIIHRFLKGSLASASRFQEQSFFQGGIVGQEAVSDEKESPS